MYSAVLPVTHTSPTPLSNSLSQSERGTDLSLSDDDTRENVFLEAGVDTRDTLYDVGRYYFKEKESQT